MVTVGSSTRDEKAGYLPASSNPSLVNLAISFLVPSDPRSFGIVESVNTESSPSPVAVAFPSMPTSVQGVEDPSQ